MRCIGYCILVGVLFPFLVTGQSSLNDLDIIFKHDFEYNTLGDYRFDEWKEDWLNPPWSNRQAELDIVQNTADKVNPTKMMQINYPAHSVGTAEGGTQWFSNLSEKYDEAYFSYDLMFMPGFQYQLGGKLPSVTGGTLSTDDDFVRPTGYDGFTGGMMFHKGGEISFYTYFADSEITRFGQTIYWGANYKPDAFSPSKIIIEYNDGTTTTCDPGTWHNITYRIVMNTIKPEGGGNYDGILESYFDGKLVTQISHMLFRHTKELAVDCIRITSFFGGSGDEWRNPIQEWMRLDNVILYTFKSSIDVPRGNKLSPPDRTINYWRKMTTGNVVVNPDVPSSPGVPALTSQTKNSVTIKWADNSNNEDGFKIYRSLEQYLNFAEVGSVGSDISSFTDDSLQPATQYYYRIRSYNDAGYSNYTGALSVTTPASGLPGAPSNLAASDVMLTSAVISWNDNSNNETGFEIERSGPDDFSIKKTFTVSPDIITFADSGLEMNKDYQYRVRAFNDEGYSGFTGPLTVHTSSPELPVTPTNLAVTEVTYTSAVIKWTDNSTNETGFELERSGPDDFGIKKIFTLSADAATFTDAGLEMNKAYQYRVRAFNNDGFSAYSNAIQVITPIIKPPVAPTLLKSTDFTDKSITVSWDDNSDNESGFVIVRALAEEPENSVSINVEANDTSFMDSELHSSTSYIYTIKAYNVAGHSPASNKKVASTLSVAETKRCKDGLIAYYNFGYDPDYVIHDLSGYCDPLDLRVLQPKSVSWDDRKKLEILSNTALVSYTPAKKIINAVKKSNEITIECWMNPVEPDLSTDARIISLASSDEEIGILLDQEFTETSAGRNLNYRVRMQTESTNPSGYPEYIPDISNTQFISLQHIVYVRDKLGKERMYINGIQSSEGFRPSDLTTWEDDYYLRLGNESDLNHPWTGTFYSVAFYDKALTNTQVNHNFSLGPCDSVQHKGLDYQINVSPNPITDLAQIEIIPLEFQEIAAQTTIKVLDMYGKVYFQKVLFNPNNYHTETIDFRNFQRGVYLLQVVSGNKQKSIKLIVR